MMRNLSSLCKRLVCVIVRRCVYTANFSVPQTKDLLLSRDGISTPDLASAHSRTLTHDSIKEPCLSRKRFRGNQDGQLLSRAVRVTLGISTGPQGQHNVVGRMWSEKSKAEPGAKQSEEDVGASENTQELNFVGEVLRLFPLYIVGALWLVTRIEDRLFVNTR